MDVTAEGVETDQQLEQIKILECTEMQGYLFSRPLPAAAIHRQFLSRRKNNKSAA
jgi:EAL domain-containing protein (putative c-di-GMP-specific phosphodiesterase class I)